MKSIKKILSDRIEYRDEKGNLHREDGPAIEFANGTKAWYLNGERHREDGPAIEYSDGSKYWYLNGKYYTEEEWEQVVTNIKLKRILTL
jgi:hypothetical protein